MTIDTNDGTTDVGESRMGTFYGNVAELRDHAQHRIDIGDPDMDDWVYRTRDACNQFITEMESIGFAVVTQQQADEKHAAEKRARRGGVWRKLLPKG